MELYNKPAITAHYLSLFTAYIYVIAAAINDGFTGVYLGTPFALFLFLDAYKFRKRNPILSAIHIVFLVFMLLVSQADRSTWKILYPAIGKTITIDKDIIVYRNPYYPFQMDGFAFNEKKENQSYILHKDEQLTIIRQSVTGHPDFGTNYVFAIKLNSDKLEKQFIKEAKNLSIDWQSIGSFYKVLPQNNIYISDYSMGAYIMNTQNNGFTTNRRFILFDIILIYPILIPVLLLLFWLLQRTAVKKVI